MYNEINMILKLNTTDSPLLKKISIPILQTTTPCRELTVNSSNDLLVGEIGPSKTIHCKYCTRQRFGAMAIRQNSGCLQKCRTSRMFANFREFLPPKRILRKLTPFTLLNFDEIDCKQCKENDHFMKSAKYYFQE